MNPEENQPQTKPTPTGPTPADISGDDATISSSTDIHSNSDLSDTHQSTTDVTDIAKAIDQLAAAAVAAAESESAPTSESETKSAPVAESETTSTPTTEPASAPEPEAHAEPIPSPEPKLESESSPNPDSSPSPEPVSENSAPETTEPSAPETTEESAPEPVKKPAFDIAAAAAELDAEAEAESGHSVSTPAFALKPAKPIPEPIEESVSPEQSAEPVREIVDEPSEDQVVAQEPAPAPKPKKKGSSLRLALIIIAAVILIAVIVVFVLFAIIGTRDDNTIVTVSETASEEDTAEESTLICNYTSSSDDLSDQPTTASYSLKLMATYLDDKLYNMTTSGTYTFTNEEDATEGLSQARLAYINRYTNLGLSSDPFSSNFQANGNNVTFSHFADANQITEKSAPLLSLNVNADGTVSTDYVTVRSIYQSKGYTCNGGGTSSTNTTGNTANNTAEDTTEDTTDNSSFSLDEQQ